MEVRPPQDVPVARLDVARHAKLALRRRRGVPLEHARGGPPVVRASPPPRGVELRRLRGDATPRPLRNPVRSPTLRPRTPAPTDPTREPALPLHLLILLLLIILVLVFVRDAAGTVELGGDPPREHRAERLVLGGFVHEPLELGEDHALEELPRAFARRGVGARAQLADGAVGVERDAREAAAAGGDVRLLLHGERRAEHVQETRGSGMGAAPEGGKRRGALRGRSVARRRLRDGRRRRGAGRRRLRVRVRVRVRILIRARHLQRRDARDDPLAEGVAQLRASGADEVVQLLPEPRAQRVVRVQQRRRGALQREVRLQEGLADVRSPEVRLDDALRLRRGEVDPERVGGVGEPHEEGVRRGRDRGVGRARWRTARRSVEDVARKLHRHEGRHHLAPLRALLAPGAHGELEGAHVDPGEGARERRRRQRRRRDTDERREREREAGAHGPAPSPTAEARVRKGQLSLSLEHCWTTTPACVERSH